MVAIKEAFKLEQISLNNKLCMKITFYGTLIQEDAIVISNEWKEIFTLNKDKKLIVIFNAKEMDDYAPMARIAIQKTINEFKHQIENIWLVTDSKLIAAGALVMGMFTSIKIKTVDVESKIMV
jgi:hypothetical protein